MSMLYQIHLHELDTIEFTTTSLITFVICTLQQPNRLQYLAAIIFPSSWLPYFSEVGGSTVKQQDCLVVSNKLFQPNWHVHLSCFHQKTACKEEGESKYNPTEAELVQRLVQVWREIGGLWNGWSLLGAMWWCCWLLLIQAKVDSMEKHKFHPFLTVLVECCSRFHLNHCLLFQILFYEGNPSYWANGLRHGGCCRDFPIFGPGMAIAPLHHSAEAKTKFLLLSLLMCPPRSSCLFPIIDSSKDPRTCLGSRVSRTPSSNENLKSRRLVSWHPTWHKCASWRGAPLMSTLHCTTVSLSGILRKTCVILNRIDRIRIFRKRTSRLAGTYCVRDLVLSFGKVNGWNTSSISTIVFPWAWFAVFFFVCQDV